MNIFKVMKLARMNHRIRKMAPIQAVPQWELDSVTA